MPELEDIVYSDDDEDVGAEADMKNLDAFIPVSPIPTTRVHKDHPIEEEVYVCQPPGFEDPDFPDKVYKVEKALYGLHQALRACQDKYVTEILKKFGFTDVKTASTPMETQKPLLKDEDGITFYYSEVNAARLSLNYCGVTTGDESYAVSITYCHSSVNAVRIASLKRRVKRVEKKRGSRTHRLKRLYKVGLSIRVESYDEEGLGEEDASKQGRIADIDADAGINLVSAHFDADTDMFGVHDLVGDEVVVESEVAVKAASTIPVSAATTTTTVITNDEITLAKALAELKSAKLPTTTAATTITAASTRPKAKGIVIHEQEQAPTPTVSSQQPSQLNVQDKGKGKMVEPKPVKKLSKKDQLMLDEELAFKLQAEEEEEEERLAREKAQQIEEVNIAWDDVQARVEADYQLAQRLQAQETELVEESSKKAKAEIAQESSSKRAGTELEQESIKKQKVDEDKETTELQRLTKIVPDEEEVAIDVIPLATETPSIEGYEKVLWGDLKTMFDPHVDDQVWRNQQDYRVLDWKIYDSCGFHSLRMQHMHIHMLVEKRYPLTPAIITDMLNKKLQCDHFSKMGRIVEIKRLHDDLEVTAAKLMPLVYKLLLLVLEANAASTKVTTAQRLRLLKEFLLSRDG
ncbi:ribonuclease H-like domain-containing protein [Tanacetum coccineum]